MALPNPAPAPPPRPAPPPALAPWACPRGHKLAFMACHLTPGSLVRFAVWCQSCKRWYEKEQAA